MRPEVLEAALRRAGATILDEEVPETGKTALSKADLYRLGLSGGPDSAARRRALCRALELPERLSANALLEVLGALYTAEELETVLKKEGEAL